MTFVRLVGCADVFEIVVIVVVVVVIVIESNVDLFWSVVVVVGVVGVVGVVYVLLLNCCVVVVGLL